MRLDSREKGDESLACSAVLEETEREIYALSQAAIKAFTESF